MFTFFKIRAPLQTSKTVADLYEKEMAFALERMYRQLRAGQFQDPARFLNITRTDCSFQRTFWVEIQGAFISWTGFINGITAIMVLISIGLSLRFKNVDSGAIRMIEVLQLGIHGSAGMGEINAEFKSYMIYRLFLLTACIVLTILTYVFIPGPSDTWTVSRTIALGCARVGDATVSANTILTILTTVEAALIGLCSSALIHHLARLWLQHSIDMKNAGMTPAALDTVFSNYLQMLYQVFFGLELKNAFVAVILLLALLLSQAIHTISQFFLSEGTMVSPLVTTVYVASSNTTSNLVQSYSEQPYITAKPTFLGLNAITTGLMDVVGACDLNTKGCQMAKEPAPIIKCGENASKCWENMDIFADFEMSCTAQFLPYHTQPLGTKSTKSLTSVLKPINVIQETEKTAPMFDSQPYVTWTIVENYLYVNLSASINCTIYPAWTNRLEDSVQGTISRTVVKVFKASFPVSENPNQWKNYQSWLLGNVSANIGFIDPRAFESSPACFGLANPWCVLSMVQEGLKGMEPLNVLGSLKQQLISNPLSRLTTMCHPYTFLLQKNPKTLNYLPIINDTVAATYENEMKFTITRMYRRFLAAQLDDPNGITNTTCTNCAVQRTFWVENKVNFMVWTGLINGIACVMVLISITLSVIYRTVPFGFIKMIEVVKLRESREGSLDDANAEFRILDADRHTISQMLYRLFLLAACIVLTVLAYVFIPGPNDTWRASHTIALGYARIGDAVVTANTILTILTTLEAALLSLCSSALIHHLARLWLHRSIDQQNAGMTPAALDTIFYNYLQMLNQLFTGMELKNAVVAAILLLTLILSHGIHTISQLFLSEGTRISPLTTMVQIPSPNTTSKLVQSFPAQPFITTAPTFLGFHAITTGLMDVVGSCDLKTQDCQVTKETAPVIKCGENASECWKEIDVFSDFEMNCTSHLLPYHSQPSGTKSTKSLTSVLSPMYIVQESAKTEPMFVTQPYVTWDIVENYLNLNFSASINCTIYPAWTKRVEDSAKGTLSKNTVKVYKDSFPVQNQFKFFQNYQSFLLGNVSANVGPLDSKAFESAPACLGLANPWCVLYMVQEGLRAMQSFSVSGSVTQQLVSNPLSRLTTMCHPYTYLLQQNSRTQEYLPNINGTVAFTFENEMKFAVTRMYRRFLAAQLDDPTGILNATCTDCALQRTFWVENKVNFMFWTGFINGFAGIMVLISITISVFYRDVPFGFIKMIEVVELNKSQTDGLNDEKAEYRVRLVKKDASGEFEEEKT
ncbi:hypothetical protein HDU79_006840 [Rhizoclosmatium sp. JEL0117]|nr:hypothetical protein HDU79_006840 [Rhizoclosmatium sp. JEL0117]